MRARTVCRPIVLGAVLALVALPSRAELVDHGTDLVVLGSIDTVRALELPPCPEDQEQDPLATPTTCGPVLEAEVRPEEFLRGRRGERLTVRFPRLPEERELAGMHAALFLERHQDALWVAEGRSGLVTSREPFIASGIDRLRLALALERRPASTERSPAAAPLMVSPDNGVSLPVVTKKVKPEYPNIARQARAQGKVLLTAVIGTDGRVSDLAVLKSAFPGWGLEIAAVRAVSQWEYEPARKDGVPVAVYMTIGVDFSLEGTPELTDGASEPEPGPFSPSAHAIRDALEEMVPDALDLGPGEPPVVESEERALRFTYARLSKAWRERDLVTCADLVHPEFLDRFRASMLKAASRLDSPELAEQLFGTRDPQALQDLTAKELWVRMSSVSLGGSFPSAGGKTENLYLGVVAEGADLRHVTQRVKGKDLADFQGVGLVTFKRDGSGWKLFPSEAFLPEEPQGEEDEE